MNNLRENIKNPLSSAIPGQLGMRTVRGWTSFLIHLYDTVPFLNCQLTKYIYQQWWKRII